MVTPAAFGSATGARQSGTLSTIGAAQAPEESCGPFTFTRLQRTDSVSRQWRANVMRYLSAVCFLAIVAVAEGTPATAQQQSCACFCRVQGEGGGGCWVDVPGCSPRSGVRACSDGAMCGYNCGTPGLPARRSAPRAHPLGQHYRPTEHPR